MNEKHRRPHIITSFMPVLFIIIVLIITVLIFGNNATSGPAQVVLILAGTFTSIFAITHGRSWEHVEKNIIEALSEVIQPVLILLLIGALIGTWMLSGIVPAIVVYGLKILNPSIFIFVSCIICCIISLATGSSWSTVGTIGVALISIAQVMGINISMTAGAIISGSYFGDKMSPFSETTNLAPSMVGIDVFSHIKHMLYTTVPALIISLILYLIIGLTETHSAYNPQRVDLLVNSIHSQFNISLFLLIPPILTFAIIIKKIPSIPAILIGTITGAIFAVVFQPQLISKIADDKTLTYAGLA